MEYRVCRNNSAPYNDLSGKISLLGLGTMRLPLRDAAGYAGWQPEIPEQPVR